MTLGQYKTYKQSNIDWLAKIPDHWNSTRIKHICSFYTGWTPPTGEAESYEGDNLWANISDLGPKWLDNTAKRVSDDAVARSRIRISPQGSLLFSFKLSIGQVSFVAKEMYTNEAIATFLPSEQLIGSYAYYALPLFLVENAATNIYGAKLLNQDLIRSAPIALPPPSEQASLASFLDCETAKIDVLVNEQKRLIELLNEKRQAVISHAVTKGLDPNAPMKDSGVEWLGEVPAHWKVKKLTHLFGASKGRNGQLLTKEYCSAHTGDYPVYSGQTENDGIMGMLNEFEFDVGGEGVLFSTTVGARAMTLMRLYGKFSLSQNCMIIAPRDKHAVVQFFYYHLQPLFRYERGKIPTHMQPSFRIDDLNSYRVALPPEEEQKSIAEHLEQADRKIDALLGELENVVALLQERRSALISAAVTGKIDVRELANSEAEAA